MKKIILMTTILVSLPMLSMAQDDDMYFVPTKESKAKELKSYGMPADTYYTGSKKSSREYNRRAWSSVAPIDSAGNDIINFSATEGVYPDSAYSEADDYACTRKMSRFDGYTPSEAYWEGYRDGRWTGVRPGWYDAWYGSWYSPWRSSWYDPWYDPWYYSSYWGWYSPYYYSIWYSPWHYGYYWDRPYWGWGGGVHISGPVHAGRSWSRSGYSHHKYAGNTDSNANRRGGSLAGYRGQRNSNIDYGTRVQRNNARDLGGYRSRSYNSNSNSSYSRPSYSNGGSSFGGSSRSGGGRSVGGGHNYGGRR